MGKKTKQSSSPIDGLTGLVYHIESMRPSLAVKLTRYYNRDGELTDEKVICEDEPRIASALMRRDLTEHIFESKIPHAKYD